MAQAPKRPSALRSIAVDVCGLSGAGLMTYGCWLAWEPLAYIAAGLMLLASGLSGARR